MVGVLPLLRVAALLVLLIVAVTYLCAGAGSRVERDYMYTVIRPYGMHCATDRGWRMGVASVYYAAVKAGGWRARECQVGKQY